MFDGSGRTTTAPVWRTLREPRAAALRGLISADLSLRPITALGSGVWRSTALRGLISADLSRPPIAVLGSSVWRSAALLPLILNRRPGWSATLLSLVAPLLCLPRIAGLRTFPPPLLLIFITVGNLLG